MPIKAKYQNVLDLGEQLAIENGNVSVENDVLKIKGTAKTQYEKNLLWDAIKAAGGEATAIFGDCADSADANNLMKKTLDTYGDLNIMVNNAGFCRDKTIVGMSDEEFDSVGRVHLRGHFVNMRNAAAYWRGKAKAGEQVFARMISTSSEAAIFGSVGQPN